MRPFCQATGRRADQEGNKYYFDAQSGESSWEKPPGSGGSGLDASSSEELAIHSRNETMLPKQWERLAMITATNIISDQMALWEKPLGMTKIND